jgi:hypothetical protein
VVVGTCLRCPCAHEACGRAAADGLELEACGKDDWSVLNVHEDEHAKADREENMHRKGEVKRVELQSGIWKGKMRVVHS